MFEEKYRNEIEQINPSEEIREKIFSSVKRKSKTYIGKSVVFRSGFAVCALAAILLSAIFVPKNDNFKATNIAVNDDIAKNVSYESLYKNFKAIAEKQKSRYKLYSKNGAVFLNSGAEGIDIEEEYIDENSVVANKTSSAASKEDHSSTTTQVEGVDEADIIKTDGEYIYYLSENNLKIIRADQKNTALVSNTDILKLAGIDKKKDGYHNVNDIYLYDNSIIAVINSSLYYKYLRNDNLVYIAVLDISSKENVKLKGMLAQCGSANSTRLIGDTLYLVTNHPVNLEKIDKDKPRTYVPYTVDCGKEKPFEESEIISCSDYKEAPVYLVAGAYNIKDISEISVLSLLGYSQDIYCSNENLIVTSAKYTKEKNTTLQKTVVTRISLNSGKLKYEATAELNGTLLNQFSIDEYNGFFRFVTTVRESKYKTSSKSVVYYNNSQYNSLVILNGKLEQTGIIDKLAKDERVYSVRFMGDTAYFVTFRQTDPLFSADLSDPFSPKIIGKLKIPGFSDYLYPYGDGKLLGIGMDADEDTGRTEYMKLSLFDISDPSNVKEYGKTVISGATYSPALFNHKATLISKEKNLIGFAADTKINIKGDYFETAQEYYIFSFCDGFKQLAKIDINRYSEEYEPLDFTRGIFAGDYFYLVSKSKVSVFTLFKFEKIKEIGF